MDKLTMHLRIILIGLSISLFFSGRRFLAWDYPELEYKENYKNETSLPIYIIFENSSFKDSLFINSYTTVNKEIFVDGEQEPISEIVDGFSRYDVIIKLFTTEKKKEWTKPSGNFGDSINSPFNYDAWVYESLENDSTGAVGQITFTITEDDLK